jgi:hypothetical protein
MDARKSQAQPRPASPAAAADEALETVEAPVSVMTLEGLRQYQADLETKRAECMTTIQRLQSAMQQAVGQLNQVTGELAAVSKLLGVN